MFSMLLCFPPETPLLYTYMMTLVLTLHYMQFCTFAIHRVSKISQKFTPDYNQRWPAQQLIKIQTFRYFIEQTSSCGQQNFCSKCPQRASMQACDLSCNTTGWVRRWPSDFIVSIPLVVAGLIHPGWRSTSDTPVLAELPRHRNQKWWMTVGTSLIIV